ncbi:hypothetical protein DPMN_166431 [Dreissena polymorpha]|uniref:Uncharacterized protein n=1 Tax=Dreissena polymorpha TaxID=45954 RepID=A0A9D4F271_DREPO|nr:hypothetical protein DPMN_166431 [Dreissena polymorpha]
MSSLYETHPEIHGKFVNGFYAIRRSKQCCARLSSDLASEQTLMRSLKNTGCRSRGTWYNEVMQPCLNLSAHVTSVYNRAIHDFTELAYTTGPQHKDSTEVRIKRDASDLEKMQTKITTFSPYTTNPPGKTLSFG